MPLYQHIAQSLPDPARYKQESAHWSPSATSTPYQRSVEQLTIKKGWRHKDLSEGMLVEYRDGGSEWWMYGGRESQMDGYFEVYIWSDYESPILGVW